MRIEDEVIKRSIFREIFLRVVNDSICTQRLDQAHVPSAAYAGHVRAVRLGDLHGERTYATRSTVDQDLLPGLNLSLVAKALQCCECRHTRMDHRVAASARS